MQLALSGVCEIHGKCGTLRSRTGEWGIAGMKLYLGGDLAMPRDGRQLLQELAQALLRGVREQADGVRADVRDAVPPACRESAGNQSHTE